jgi:hypothetical protein
VHEYNKRADIEASDDDDEDEDAPTPDGIDEKAIDALASILVKQRDISKKVSSLVDSLALQGGGYIRVNPAVAKRIRQPFVAAVNELWALMSRNELPADPTPHSIREYIVDAVHAALTIAFPPTVMQCITAVLVCVAKGTNIEDVHMERIKSINPKFTPIVEALRHDFSYALNIFKSRTDLSLILFSEAVTAACEFHTTLEGVSLITAALPLANNCFDQLCCLDVQSDGALGWKALWVNIFNASDEDPKTGCATECSGTSAVAENGKSATAATTDSDDARAAAVLATRQDEWKSELSKKTMADLKAVLSHEFPEAIGFRMISDPDYSQIDPRPIPGFRWIPNRSQIDPRSISNFDGWMVAQVGAVKVCILHSNARPRIAALRKKMASSNS